MKTYTLDEAAALLGISRNTLPVWMRKAGIRAAQALYDERYHYLTEEQVQALARAHGRVVGEQPDPLRELRERLANVESALGVRQIIEETPPLARSHIARWLEQHGALFNTTRQRTDLPLEPRAALIYVQEHLNAVGSRKGRNQLHPCSDPSCVCHEVLELSETQETLF